MGYTGNGNGLYNDPREVAAVRCLKARRLTKKHRSSILHTKRQSCPMRSHISGPSQALVVRVLNSETTKDNGRVGV